MLGRRVTAAGAPYLIMSLQRHRLLYIKTQLMPTAALCPLGRQLAETVLESNVRRKYG